MCKDTQKETNIQREVKKSNIFNENILFHAQNRLTLQPKHLHLLSLWIEKDYICRLCVSPPYFDIKSFNPEDYIAPRK